MFEGQVEPGTGESRADLFKISCLFSLRHNRNFLLVLLEGRTELGILPVLLKVEGRLVWVVCLS